MVNNNFLFTIIVPFYETINYVDQTLQSLLTQNKIDQNVIQVLLIDDGSKHEIKSKIIQYKNKGLNIEYHRKNNGNWGSVINFVKNNNLAKGQYITILDSDDFLSPECLFSVSTFVQQHPSDIVACDYYEWNSKTNHKKRAHTIWAYKNKHYSSLTKKIWKLKTPYSLPIVKFYRNIVFKRSQDLEEGIPYQDQNLYYQCLYLSSSYGYIHLPLGFWRNDRSDSSTNMPWNKSKVDAWVNFIKTTANFDAKMNACFFLTVKQFAKAYQQYYQEPFALNGKLKKCYILKCFVPLAHLFVFYLRIKYRKIVVFKSK